MKRLPPIQARTANPLLDFTEGGEGGWSEVCETVTCLSDVQFRLLCQILAQFCRWIFRKIYKIFFGFLVITVKPYRSQQRVNNFEICQDLDFCQNLM